ncbi:tetratricopeptide repeat protein [Hyphococcus sp. DH-69]|uniref:tetratricopeptide repeat protein n=1 Tax=Hyphococcus formosus TaxID=3143534 RepID=UPI00398B0945
MKARFLLSAAAASFVLGGFGITAINSQQQNEDAVPFLHPLMIAKSICGERTDGFAMRRAFFVSAATAYAAESDDATDTENMLQSNLGHIQFAVTTSKPEAQAWFNQGLAHMFNFNHGAAVKAFKQAQKIDPECAMCFWGEAYALGPNINAPMGDDAVAPAWEAINKALALRSNADEKERELINALGYRYEAQPIDDRAKLDNAFADAMDAVAIKYPDDDFVASIAAEANMDTQPWDYWEADARTPKGRTARTISLIETVLARNPDYPAAIHLYIHMTEASQNPYRAADHADRLAALSPGLGHLIHMPSHTYFRIGRFKQALDHNIDAVAADETYLAGTDDASRIYEYGYFTHNVHFALTAAQMAGDGDAAMIMAEKLNAKLPLDMADAAPWIQPIKAAPYFAMVQFSDSDEILSAEDPGDTLPFLKGAWHYARGEAYAKRGDVDNARAEAEAISALISDADFSALADGGVPVLDIMRIAQLTVTARASLAEGDLATAIEAMENATALQEALPYMEPAYWYYPSKQTLAALVLMDGQTERAEQLFLETLTASPNNAWVLYGLAETYRAQGDKDAAKYADRLFKQAWAGPKKSAPELTQL